MTKDTFLDEPPSNACFRCRDEGWVCENHPNSPWLEGTATCCEGGCGAGMPCVCNKEIPPWDYIPWWKRKKSLQ